MIASPSTARAFWRVGAGKPVERGGVFADSAVFLKTACSISYFLRVTCWLFMKGFFVEGSILAQDERWRRA